MRYSRNDYSLSQLCLLGVIEIQMPTMLLPAVLHPARRLKMVAMGQRDASSILKGRGWNWE